MALLEQILKNNQYIIITSSIGNCNYLLLSLVLTTNSPELNGLRERTNGGGGENRKVEREDIESFLKSSTEYMERVQMRDGSWFVSPFLCSTKSFETVKLRSDKKIAL